MEVKKTVFKDLIEGTKQYIIPLFQRTYDWGKKELEIFWEDLIELAEMDNPKNHFFGSIVSMPTVNGPEDVTKYLLIDGQQRLTTVFILLILIRNKSKEEGNNSFSEEINDTLIVNKYKQNNDYYKLIPTQVDRDSYKKLIKNKKIDHGENNKIIETYKFLERKLRESKIPYENIKNVITKNFLVVSIVLENNDNPYLVFESLNAKGRILTQADLIRNYFFMKIKADEQDKIYKEYWLPMEESLKDNMTEFIRHYLMKDGKIIKKDDVYYSLKENISNENVIEYISDLKKHSEYYKKLINPEYEENTEIQNILERLNRIEVTTVYPLLLNFYNDYNNRKIDKDYFVKILKVIENYLIRRFICNYPTNQLNKIFPLVYNQIQKNYSENILKV